jgi:dTDP-4-amino-4,6-dideoxygalactose transaminase
VSIPIANPFISEAARGAVDEVLQSGMIADGEEVRKFENEFADYIGTEHAVATSSGTTALHAMLEAAGIGEGDVVLTTPFSFVASANAIIHAGAEVTFADVRQETFNLDPDAVRDVLDERNDVTALLPVHLYGFPADMREFRLIAREYDLQLFEDAAQAHGATYDGEMVGSLGDAGAFSFYPTKNMTTAEGGMITTDDDELAERARRLVDHGRSDRYEHVDIGYNYRMTNVTAAIGREQLDRLSGWIERRRENARGLTDRLGDHSDIQTPSCSADRSHAYHQYTIRVLERESVIDTLESHNIGYGIYYPRTIPEQPAYADQTDLDVPIARSLSDRVLSLPIHPSIEAADLDAIADAVSNGIHVADDREVTQIE